MPAPGRDHGKVSGCGQLTPTPDITPIPEGKQSARYFLPIFAMPQVRHAETSPATATNGFLPATVSAIGKEDFWYELKRRSLTALTYRPDNTGPWRLCRTLGSS